MKRIQIILVVLIVMCGFAAKAQYYKPSKDTFYFKPGKRGAFDYFVEGDTLITESGFKFYKGQEIKVGEGTMSNGYFKFIQSIPITDNAVLSREKFFYTDPPSGFSRSTGHSSEDNMGNNTQKQFVSPTMSGRSLYVVHLFYRGNKKLGYKYYPILAEANNGRNKAYGPDRYFLDYESAVNFGEIIYPGKAPIKKAGGSVEVKLVQETAPLSVTDELLKLKKLLDAGAITQEEYEIAKKKLLDKIK